MQPLSALLAATCAGDWQPVHGNICSLLMYDSYLQLTASLELCGPFHDVSTELIARDTSRLSVRSVPASKIERSPISVVDDVCRMSGFIKAGIFSFPSVYKSRVTTKFN